MSSDEIVLRIWPGSNPVNIANPNAILGIRYQTPDLQELVLVDILPGHFCLRHSILSPHHCAVVFELASSFCTWHLTPGEGD